MVSRDEENKKAANLQEKYQLLRSVTKSNSVKEESILVDASKYIQGLKEKVEELNQDISSSSTCPNNNCNYELSTYSTNVVVDDEDDRTLMPKIRVKSMDKGFEIKVTSKGSCQGLLVFILQATEELNLEVLNLDAMDSSYDHFYFHAIAQENDEVDGLDAQTVWQALSNAIKKWSSCT